MTLWRNSLLSIIRAEKSQKATRKKQAESRASCSLIAYTTYSLCFDDGSIFIRNVSKFLPDYTESHDSYNTFHILKHLVTRDTIVTKLELDLIRAFVSKTKVKLSL
jgi:hypothetical protein